MKNYLIAVFLFSLFSCSSNVKKDDANIAVAQSSLSATNEEFMQTVEDKPFKEYLSNFKTFSPPLTFTVDSIGSFLHTGRPEFKPKPVKKLSLADISTYISKSEAEEKSKLQYQSHLEYYYVYILKTANKNIISCLILKHHIDVVAEYILLNYELNGTLIDKLQVVASYNDDQPKAYEEKSCIIQDIEDITVKTKITKGDLTAVTIITEKYKVDSAGKFILTDKKEEKKSL